MVFLRSGDLRRRRTVSSRRSQLETLERRQLLAAEIGIAPHPIFAPGTPQDTVNYWDGQGHGHGHGSSDGEDIDGPSSILIGNRWEQSAIDFSPTRGEPIAVTWSIVRDGTTIISNTGADLGESNFIAFMDGIYGGEEFTEPHDKPWFRLVSDAYEEWSILSGIDLIYEPNDSGDRDQTNVGEAGVRGDLRIAGAAIDGNSGVLARNFAPVAGGRNGLAGDMLVDTTDNFYSRNADDVDGENRAFHNVITHEVGHGLGLAHSEPVNSTKLMEPFINFAFFGVQEDDILNVQSLYGDAGEANDSTVSATDLGRLVQEQAEATGRSIDRDADRDFYRFEAAGSGSLTVTLTPTGTAYDVGPQFGVPGPVDRLAQADLGFRILAPDGVSEIIRVDDNVEGIAETISELTLPGAGNYFIEVFGDTPDTNNENSVQVYDLTVFVSSPSFIEETGSRLQGVTAGGGETLDFDGSTTLELSPTELQFRFSGEPIDLTTMPGGLRIHRAGLDRTLGTPDDIRVEPATFVYDVTGDVVIARFADRLPDDTYRIELYNEAVDDPTDPITPILDVAGDPIAPRTRGANRDVVDFDLELGSRVVGVVPEPVIRLDDGSRDALTDTIHVYFDDPDLFAGDGSLSLRDPAYYQLIRTGGTVSTGDDSVVIPTSVTVVAQDELAGGATGDDSLPGSETPTLTLVNVYRVELQFDQDLSDIAGGEALRLKVGERIEIDAATGDPIFSPPVITDVVPAGDPGSVASAAFDLGAVSTGEATALSITSTIEGGSLPFDLPGRFDDPGNRDIGDTNHIIGGASDVTPELTTIRFSFALDRPYGEGADEQPVSTTINAAQQERVREALGIYSYYLGVQFIETTADDADLTIVVGDLFPVGPTSGPGEPLGGNDGSSLVVLDAAESWYNGFGRDDASGPSFFETALIQIGEVLGLGATDDLPDLTFFGGEDAFADTLLAGGEIYYPGVVDVVHGRHLYRPDNRDVDFYSFTVPAGLSGTIDARTLVDLSLVGGGTLDTHLSLFEQTADGPLLLSANDDSFGRDSALDFEIEAADADRTFFVAVTASGNENFDPAIENSGRGAATSGDYELSLTFRPDTDLMIDAAGTPIDGDADGVAGGAFNFWFRAGGEPDTIYVDAAYSVASGASDGSLAAPFVRIDDALAAAEAGQSVRVLGNAGADGIIGLEADNFQGANDNVAYQIGRIESLDQTLPDGRNLIVPAGVNLVIDAGVIMKMAGSRISVGSGDGGTDASGGSLQVLGVPHLPVFMTSFNDRRLGLQSNPLALPAAPGQWGGIDIRGGVDQSQGREFAEDDGIFLNAVIGADIRYGGGSVLLNGSFQAIEPIRIDSARPSIINNSITVSSSAAISADPAAFTETTFAEPNFQRDDRFVPDYDRVGPSIYGNTIVGNSINALLVRIDSVPGGGKETLATSARFDDIEVVHVLSDDLIIDGQSVETIENAPAPSLVLTSLSAAPVAGEPGLAAGDYTYRISVIDAFGYESLLSDETTPITVADGDSVTLSNLPAAQGEFISRRLYRSTDGATFELVAELDRSTQTVTDSATDAGIAFSGSDLRSRLDGRLQIDPGIIIKSGGVRIELDLGADLIAEGGAAQPIVFTSRDDDRYGAGGTLNTDGGAGSVGLAGDWAGIYARPASELSLDHVVIAFAGGDSSIDGSSATFNPIEIRQAEARIAHSLFESNASGFTAGDGERQSRGTNTPATIFVLAATPVLTGNTIIGNFGSTAAISMDVNSLDAVPRDDLGRQTGSVDRSDFVNQNYGPLIRGNELAASGLAGLVIRGDVLAAASVWDDTDITHVVTQGITDVDMQHSGGLRLASRAGESLVVKFDANTLLRADGRPLDIADRIGGSLHVVGTPDFPVVLTSLNDDTAGAGFDPFGQPLLDTNGNGNLTLPAPGDWFGLELLEFSNDTNVEIVTEAEADTTADFDPNGDVERAKALGQLGTIDVGSRISGGDENLRMGFTIHGTVSTPGDTDVYRFRGDAGSVIWIDIDRTDSTLDSVIELVRADGTVVASSDDSFFGSLTGIAQPLRQSAFAPTNAIDPATYRDFDATSERDAGMRVVLPGQVGVTDDFFLRVRGADNSTGIYQAQIRLTEDDQFGGSVIRGAEIRYGVQGITVLGMPSRSPLVGEAALVQGQTVDLGNIANSDRGMVRLSGSLTSQSADTADLDNLNRYRFTLDRDSGGAGTALGVTFDIDFADGFARPDTSLLLYYLGADGTSQPTLVMIGENSNVTGDRVVTGGESDGSKDGFIGSVELNEGVYEIAVVNGQAAPAEFDQQFVADPANPNIRLEPASGVIRIAEDRFGGPPSETIGAPAQTVAFDGTSGVSTFGLGDVELFVLRGNLFASEIGGINPQTGIGRATYGEGLPRLSDFAVAPNQFTLAASGETGTDAETGVFYSFDFETGTATVVGNSGLETFDTTGADPDFEVEEAGDGDGVGMFFRAVTFTLGADEPTELFGVAGRSDGSATFNQATLDNDGNITGTTIVPAQNYLYALNPETGEALNAIGGDRVDNERGTGAGTNRVEIGRIAGPDIEGLVTGLTEVNGDLFAVTDAGDLVLIENFELDRPANRQNDRPIGTHVASVQDADGNDIQFTGLNRGPVNIPGYEDTLFATGRTGPGSNTRLYVLDPGGNLLQVLHRGAESIEVPGGARIAFGPMDANPWHLTDNRGGDEGHGAPGTDATQQTARPGGNSLYFGISEDHGATLDDELITAAGNTYNVLAGAHGSVESAPMDLSAYVAEDEPTLYFNYFAETEDANTDPFSNDPMLDSIRVYATSDQRDTWVVLATNNSERSEDNPAADPDQVDNLVEGPSSGAPAREIYDTAQWRQARAALTGFAGETGVRLRLEFNTAGQSELLSADIRGRDAASLLSVPAADRSFTIEDFFGGDTFTFEFDGQLTLRPVAGASLVDGSQFTAETPTDGAVTFQFSQSVAAGTAGVTEIVYEITDSADEITDRIVDAMTTSLTNVIATTDPATGLVELVSAANPVLPDPISIPASSTLTDFLFAETPGVDAANVAIPVAIGDDAIAVRDSMRTVIAQTVSGDDAAGLAPYPVFRDAVKLFGFNVTDAGPLTVFDGSVALAQNGAFASGDLFDAAAKARGNNFEGVHIDDIIIGFAERGEMVFGASEGNTAIIGTDDLPTDGLVDFPLDPAITPITTGAYQLEIRLSAETSHPLAPSIPVRAVDTNDVIGQAFGFVADETTAAAIADGDFINISDGRSTVRFEFQTTESNDPAVAGVSSGAIPVLFNSRMTANELVVAIRDAINRADVQETLSVVAAGRDGRVDGAMIGNEVLLIGPAAADQAGGRDFFAGVDGFTLSVYGDEVLGPQNNVPMSPIVPYGIDSGDLNRFRNQGQVILSDNVIVDNSNFGIIVDAGRRNRNDIAGPDNPVGNLAGASTQLPRPGSTLAYPTANLDNQTTGVVIVNNIVARNGDIAGDIGGGIALAGDDVAGVTAPAPFARVINNTIAANNGGVLIVENAAPTLANNAVVGNTFGIGVDATITNAELFATLYANNTDDTIGIAPGGFAIQTADDVFTDLLAGNFYPADQSLLIDNAIGAIDDRLALRTLRQTLGLDDSPILAPQRDLAGVLRVDDPAVNNSSGTGANVLIDIGAIERGDFVGPRAALDLPLDDSPADLDSTDTYVRLVDGTLDQFEISLADFAGIGINDATVTSSAVSVSRDGVLLRPVDDYQFAYSPNTNTIVLTPVSGQWDPDSAYEITLNNRDRAVFDLPPGNQLVDGQQIRLTDVDGNEILIEFDSGFDILVNPLIEGNADGTIVRYQSGQLVAQIELDSDGVTAPGSTTVVAVDETETAGDLAVLIADALASSNLGIDRTTAISDETIHIGGRAGDRLTVESPHLVVTGTPGVSAGAEAVPFVPSRSFTREVTAGNVVALLSSFSDAFDAFTPGGGRVFVARGTTAEFVPLVSANGIKDKAGNDLQANRENRETQFTIVLPGAGIDFGDAPTGTLDAGGTLTGGYPTSLIVDGARHAVGENNRLFLGGSVDTETDVDPAPAGDDATTAVAVADSGPFVVAAVLGGASLSLVDPIVTGDVLVLSIGGVDRAYEFLLAGQTATAGRHSVLTIPGEPQANLLRRLGEQIQRDLAGGVIPAAAAGRVEVLSPDPTQLVVRSRDDENGVGIADAASAIPGVFVDSDGDITGFLNPLAPEGSLIDVTASGPGLLDAWVDYNGDGDFTDGGEQVLRNVFVQGGVNQVRVAAPGPNTVAGLDATGTTWMRFRLSSGGNTLEDGLQIGGEIEDYEVAIIAAAIPEAADTTFDTLVEDTDFTGSIDSATVTNGVADLAYQLVNRPAGGTLTSFDTATGAFDYTPTPDRYGDDVFTYRITGTQTVDGVEYPVSSELIAVTLSVAPVNDIPVPLDRTGDDAIVMVETTNASPTVLNISPTQLIAGGLPKTLETGETQAPWNESEQSLRLVQIYVNDETGTRVEVNPIDAAANAIDAASPYIADAYVRDADDNPFLAGSVAVSVTGGVVTNVAFTPSLTFNRDNPNGASETFAYGLADDGATTLPDGTAVSPLPNLVGVGSASVAALPRNDEPSANTDEVSVDEGGTLEIPFADLIVNDTAGPAEATDENDGTNDGAVSVVPQRDTDGTFIPITTSAGGNVTLNATGDGFVYVPPTEDFFGLDTFEYTIIDEGVDISIGMGGNDVRTPRPLTGTGVVQINVTNLNDTPTVNSVSSPQIALEDADPVTIMLSGISAGGGDPEAVTVTAVSDNPTVLPNPTVEHDGFTTTASLTYQPAADQYGTATVTVTVDDGMAAATTSFVVEIQPVNDAPTGGLPSTLSIPENAPLQILPIVGFGPGGVDGNEDSQPVRVSISLSDPTLLTATPVTGIPGETDRLEILPAADRFGETTITVTIEDGGLDNNLATRAGNLTITRTIDVTIGAENDPPSFDPIADQSFPEGEVDRSILITGITPGPFETESVLLDYVIDDPSLFTADSINHDGFSNLATLSLTPAPFVFGSTTITVTADDGLGGTFSDTFVFTIEETNDPPTLDPIDDQTTLEEQDFAITLTGISAGPMETGPVTVTASSTDSDKIDALTFNDVDQTLTIDVADDAVGEATVVVTVTDEDGLSTSQTFTVDIENVDDAPTAVDDSFFGNEDNVLSIPAADLLANDIDPDLDVDGESLVIVPPMGSITTALGGTVTFDETTNRFTYDPRDSETLNALAADSDPLTDSFTYEMTDTLFTDGVDEVSSVATITVAVAGRNDAPTVVDDIVTVPTENGSVPTSPFVVDLLANDFDPDEGGSIDPGSLIITEDPQHGVLTREDLPGGGFELVYSPLGSFTGNDSFRYTIADNLGQQGRQGNVTIMVVAVPVTGADFAGTNGGDPVAIDVLANDAPGDGDLVPESLAVVTPPSNGFAEVIDGEIVYTPADGFYGNDTLRYTVGDTGGNVSEPTIVSISNVESGRQNSLIPGDVNASGLVTPLDALLVIQRLSDADSTTVIVDEEERGPNFWDVNGDMRVTPGDALSVIITLAEMAQDSESVEGEWVGDDSPHSIFVDTITSVTPRIELPSSPRLLALDDDDDRDWAGADVDDALEQLF